MRQSQRLTILGMLLTAVFTACLGHAEEGRLSVRTIAVEDSKMPVWYLATGGETFEELKWPVEEPASAIVSVSSLELQLFSKETNAKGEVEFKVARKLTIPEGSRDVLLVAWPDEGDEKVGLMLVADDLKQAKSNDWLLINTSKQAVTLRYGTKGEAIQLESHEAKPYRIDVELGQGSAVSAQMMRKGEWKSIFSTYWAAPDNQRSLILFFDNSSRVKLHRVMDPLPPTK